MEIHYRCKSTSKMEWFFHSVNDGLLTGLLEVGDLSLKKLRTTGGKVGMTDVILMRKQMRDFLIGRFLDVRNIHSDFKQKLRALFATHAAFRQFRTLDGSGDTSFLAAWPKSAAMSLDLIETTCFTYCGSDVHTVRTGIKNGKTAQEILEKYQPFKCQIEQIDSSLSADHSVANGDEDVVEGAGGHPTQQQEAQHQQQQQGGEGGGVENKTMCNATIVEDKWLDYVRRHLSKFCVLIVEHGMSQTQLQTAMASVALGTTRGGSAGNVIIHFDANLFGESITAPHIRKPPLQPLVIQRIWKATQATRANVDQVGMLPPGDVLLLIDGGRKNDTFLNYFGMGKDRKSADKGRTQRDGKTLMRHINIYLEEKSVRARKYRKKTKNDFIACTQKAYILYNSTSTTVCPRQHKHFPDMSNMADMIGPITLTPWTSCEKLMVKDKKAFWGARRRAVGGPTEGGSSGCSDDDESEGAVEGEDVEELPDVGGGRGAPKLAETSLQPISDHALPVLVATSLHHAFWGMSTIDLTPGYGELAIDQVLQCHGYLGICQTDYQKQHIMKQLERAMYQAMQDPSMTQVYCPAFTAERSGDTTGKKRESETTVANKDKLPKTESASGSGAGAGDPAPSTGLSAALQQMLAAAKAS